MATILTGNGNGNAAGRRGPLRVLLGRDGDPRGAAPHPGHPSRPIPLGRVTAYYLALVGVSAALIGFVPGARDVFVAPLPESLQLFPLDRADAGAPGALPTAIGVLDRAIRTLGVMLGALSLVLPVAWIYMQTKRLRYDPSLVQSVIVLPIVVAGILMVAKNSVAVAFGVVGIVAAVRFRNTLEDPKDAVYVFLALAIGVAAGVQALDVALVTSLTFNPLILLLWRFNVGSVYGGEYGRTGMLAIGDRSLQLGQQMADRRKLRLHLRRDAREVRSDGILLAHTADSKSARRAVEESLHHHAKDWRLAEVMARSGGYSTLEYVLRLKKDSSALDLVSELDDHWSEQVAGIEYLPFRVRT